MNVQAAAISLQGISFVVVLVGLELVNSPGEADMAIDTLQAKFGGVTVVLMAQKDDSTPVYYGNQDIVQLLEDLPVDKMPWKEYEFSV